MESQKVEIMDTSGDLAKLSEGLSNSVSKFKIKDK